MPGKTKHPAKVKIINLLSNAASGACVGFLEMLNAQHESPAGEPAVTKFMQAVPAMKVM